MKEIEQEVLNHIPDPLAKLVRKKWNAEGKNTWQTQPNREMQACNR